MGFPADETFYSNPTHTSPKEDTMTDNIQTLTEAGYPLQLHYVSGIDCPFVLTAGDISVVGFDDRDLAARTLQDADDACVQIDHNGTSVIYDGEELSHSDYNPFLAVMDAVQKIAGSGRRWLHQRLDLSPDEIEDASDDYVEWSEGDIVDGPTGLGIVLPAGEVWHLSDEKALSLMRGLSTMICHRLTQPWSADDESTILSRGIRKEA